MTITTPPNDHTHNPTKNRSPSYNPTQKAQLAQVFMQNSAFAESFFRIRMGPEGMKRFRALKTYLHSPYITFQILGNIVNPPHIGTLALLQRYFDNPSDEGTRDTYEHGDEGHTKGHGHEGIPIGDGEREKERERERVRMGKWCWIFLGAWIVGEAGRVLKERQRYSVNCDRKQE